MKQDYGVLDELKITVLIENTADFNGGLVSQHGISFFVEAQAGKTGMKILFDTGRESDALLNNMALLGKDPASADLIFLSHCHHDHTGGLKGVLAAAGREKIPVICHPAIHRVTLNLNPTLKSIGMGPENSAAALEALGGELVPLSEPLPLMNGVVTTGEIEERVAFESVPSLALVTIDKGRVVPDSVPDDVSIVFIMPRGLVILTGCSHAGIVSIIKQAIMITGIDQVHAVIGGFHLISADEDRIDKTVRALADLNEPSIYTGHCTGIKAEAKLITALGSRFKKLSTGMKIDFSAKDA